MADLGAALRTFILGNQAVASLIGNRFYPDDLPQEYKIATGPALAYQVISTQPGYLLNAPDGLARSRVEFTSFARTRAAANQVYEAVRKCGLAGFTGDMHGVEIESSHIESGATSMTEKPTDGSQELRYLTVFDFLIVYQESE